MAGIVTGKILIDWGYSPGPWFPAAIEAARRAEADGRDARAAVAEIAPKPVEPMPPRPAGALGYARLIEPGGEDELRNVEAVTRTMDELMRVPTVRAGAVMPDACPAGPVGTIPVGGVVATENAIHPGMHSADICCSVAISILGHADPKKVLDAGMALSHFGGGGRASDRTVPVPDAVMQPFDANPFLKGLVGAARTHFATQGDGNHFFYVGRLGSTGEVALVTHHGSRGPGALLYKAGMTVAERTRQRLSPETAPGNAWIVAESREGEDYWAALQAVRGWTKASHFAIHDLVAAGLGLGVRDRFWNEHNFIFRKSDGLFYHAKGATPAFPGFAADDSGLTLIPLNMAAPILITRGRNDPAGLGFAPHGAGRNFSRSEFFRRHAGRPPAEIVAAEAPGIDVRYFCGVPDISELPSAYKDAASVRAQVERFGLARIVDVVEPIGNIMAGDWQRDAPWRKKQAHKRAAEERRDERRR